MLENLSPEAVETIAQIIFAIIVLIASALGIKFGFTKKRGDEEETYHEIKGAIISDAKANEIIRYMEENTQSNRELIGALHLLRESVRDAKQEIKDLMRDFNQELRYTLRENRK